MTCCGGRVSRGAGTVLTWRTAECAAWAQLDAAEQPRKAEPASAPPRHGQPGSRSVCACPNTAAHPPGHPPGSRQTPPQSPCKSGRRGCAGSHPPGLQGARGASRVYALSGGTPNAPPWRAATACTSPACRDSLQCQHRTRTKNQCVERAAGSLGGGRRPHSSCRIPRAQRRGSRAAHCSAAACAGCTPGSAGRGKGGQDAVCFVQCCAMRSRHRQAPGSQYGCCTRQRPAFAARPHRCLPSQQGRRHAAGCTLKKHGSHCMRAPACQYYICPPPPAAVPP